MTRVFRAAMFLALTSALASCFGTRSDLIDAVSVWNVDTKTIDADDAVAVMLLREVKVDFNYQRGRTDWTFHNVIRIDTEAALDLANIKLSVSPGEEMLDFYARTIEPSGEIHEIDDVYVFDDESTVNGEVIRQKMARIPGVQVGRIVEYVYRTRQSGLYGVLFHPMATGLPTKQFRFDMYVTKDVSFQTRTYNTSVQPTFEREGTGFRVGVELFDVPSVKEEKFGAPYLTEAPWLAFSVKQFGSNDPINSWSRAMSGFARFAYVDDGDDHFDGYSSDIEEADDETVKQRVARAVSHVGKQTKFTGLSGSLYRNRPLKRVVSSKRANSIERAYLLFKTLEALDVEALLVPSLRVMSRGVDKDFFSPLWFNHLVLMIPAQDDLAKPFFVDPSCTGCAVGELPSWSLGSFGMALTPRRDLTAKFFVEAEPVIVEGKPRADVNGVHTAIDMTLDRTGRVKGTLAREHAGDEAFWWATGLSDTTDTSTTNDARRDFDRRFSVGTVTAQKPPVCEEAEGRCQTRRVTFSADSVGQQVGQRMVVPLAFMRADPDSDFASEKRRADLYVAADVVVEETVVLRKGKGIGAVVEFPRNERVESPAFVSTLTTVIDDDTVTITRKLLTRRGQFPAKEFAKLRAPVRHFANIRHQLVSFAVDENPPMGVDEIAPVRNPSLDPADNDVSRALTDPPSPPDDRDPQSPPRVP